MYLYFSLYNLIVKVMGNVFSRFRNEIRDMVRNCRSRDEEEDVKTIISDYSTLERDRRKCAEKSPNVHLQRFDSDTGEEWKSMVLYPSHNLSHSSPCIEDRISKTDVSSVCSTPLIVPGRISLATTYPSSRENSNYSLFRELSTLSDESDDFEIFTKAGLRARYTLTCPDRESLKSVTQPKTDKEEKSTMTPVDELEKRQEEVLKRLGVIQDKVSQLEKKYNVTSAQSSQSGSTSGSKPVVLQAGKLHDIVIYIDPLSIPYSLLVLYQQLQQHFSILASTHLHSSISSIPDNIQNLFDNGLVQCRKDYQIALTVIWKKVPFGPRLMVDPSKQTAIEGEVNVARYLQRLLDSSFDNGDAVEATQIDEWLDTAQTQYINGSNKERAAVMRSLNAKLGKSSWLVGDKCSVADVTMWSVLQQTGQVDNVPGNVKKWLTSCNDSSLFSYALKFVQ